MSPSHNNATDAQYEANFTLQVGDHVEYHAVGGGNVPSSATTGEIKDVIDSKAPAGETGVRVNAPKDDPRYVIENDNTGKETAYKAQNIKGTTD
ncbi:hypothetical protein D9758_002881 [Tetrapyrgos nigripes]|uniref:Hypervirulence associated protein TUDOR domain-containing protein n=1 Tax=Tetrapyrgos nigripes TaxID=182062 RepID=A0A8H5GQ14_9AGAR|nr:hypothetical protein D9758_002881 [Tetrapyrgos nigripes]